MRVGLDERDLLATALLSGFRFCVRRGYLIRNRGVFGFGLDHLGIGKCFGFGDDVIEGFESFGRDGFGDLVVATLVIFRLEEIVEGLEDLAWLRKLWRSYGPGFEFSQTFGSTGKAGVELDRLAQAVAGSIGLSRPNMGQSEIEVDARESLTRNFGKRQGLLEVIDRVCETREITRADTHQIKTIETSRR